MKLKIAYFLLFSYLGSFCALFGNLTMFIRPYPEKQAVLDPDKMARNIATPGKLASKIMKDKLLKTSSNDGIFSTYFGYLALSDINGQLTFPRKQQKPLFNLLITPKIKPVFMIGNTIHHWELDTLVPAELYTVERKQDPETKDWFWQTKKGNLPANNIVSLDTIVIFAKPQTIVVPQGITLTDKNPQLVLPDIYAKKSLNITARSLWALTVRSFFGLLKNLVQKNSPTYFSQHLNVK